MRHFKTSLFLLIVGLLIVGFVAVMALVEARSGVLAPAQLQVWLRSTGGWAPVLYILLYTIATVLLLPSTPLNLLGGALFGAWLGMLWTSAGAMMAAIVTFAFTRSIGQKMVARHLAKRWQTARWQTLDAELRRGGLFYMVAIRLVPFMPYGLLNFAAGLTSVSYRDYLLGTFLGTTPGILPYVLLGSSGLRAMRTGDLMPLVGALALTGILIGGSTWYRRQRSLHAARSTVPSEPAPPEPASSSEYGDSEPDSSSEYFDSQDK